CADVDFIVRGEGEQTLCETSVRWSAAGRSTPSPGWAIARRTASSSTRRALWRRWRAARCDCRTGTPECSTATLCSFCSIIEMRGRNFHPYELDRVLADIADARKHGAQAIFLVDDNITPDVRRFQRLCEARIFTVRGSSSSAVLLSATRTTRARRSKRTSRSRMSTEFRNRRLIVNEDVSHYDGTTAVVRTDHLESGEIEFLRWRAERWMKF